MSCQRQKSLVWTSAEDLNPQGAVVSAKEEEKKCSIMLSGSSVTEHGSPEGY